MGKDTLSTFNDMKDAKLSLNEFIASSTYIRRYSRYLIDGFWIKIKRSPGIHMWTLYEWEKLFDNYATGKEV